MARRGGERGDHPALPFLSPAESNGHRRPRAAALTRARRGSHSVRKSRVQSTGRILIIDHYRESGCTYIYDPLPRNIRSAADKIGAPPAEHASLFRAGSPERSATPGNIVIEDSME
jgi:hypothetical protein